MPRRSQRRLLAAGALILAVLAAAAVVAFTSRDDGGGSAAAKAIDAYVAAWSRGDDRAAAALTDRPEAAARALRLSRAGLDGATVRATVAEREEADESETARVAVRWEVPRFGAFAHEVRLTAGAGDTGARLRWSDAMVHPRLRASTRLGTTVERPRRGAILDRAGRPLVTERAVVDIAVQTDKVRDPAATATALGALLDVEPRALARRIRAAGPGRFIPVITLRRAAFRSLEEPLTAIPGVSLNRTTAQLAPSAEFARAVLGTVGPATAEQVEQSGGRLADGDVAGQSGLEQAFDERLAGTPSRRVVVRERATGTVAATLARRKGRPGRPLRTRLDLDVQDAAEQALEGDGEAALVAVQPSSGDVLAVVNRPGDSTYDRALLGRYPPGSTFKVVSTAALLRAGLRTDEIVDCPATLSVDGKPFRNFEGSAQGPVPFREDFAQSCNTAFVSLAGRLGRGDLTEVARAFGLGEKLEPGVAAVAADVPPPRDAVGKAAMLIGQDRILASPLAMAGVAATVAEGRWRSPRLLAGAPRRAGRPLDPATLATLRDLMRAVVESGTGTALAGVPGEVRGKSGTAEFGGGDPPPTHAWFVAMRGDLALAVLVEGGESGGRVAAPVARAFFDALGGS